MTGGAHSPRRATLFAVSVATLGLFVLRYGYDWGVSDQDEFLPLLLHLSDPELLTSDPFVATQQGAWSIRSAFVWFMHGLSAGVVPLGLVVLLVYLVSWLATALAISRIAASFAASTWASVISIPAALIVTMRWAPGGNDAVYAMLVPEMVAWSLALWALALVTLPSPRTLLAGILCGLATWIHVLVGLQLGGVILLWLMARHQGRPHALTFGATWLLLSVPPAWLAVSGVGLDADSTYILTHLRAPHHYLPHDMPLRAWLLFAALLVSAAFSLYRHPEFFRGESGRRRLAGLLVIPTAWLAVGFVLVLLWPGGTWTAAQPFKLAVLVRLLAVVAISCSAAGLLERLFHGRADAVAPGSEHRIFQAALIIVLSAGGLIALSDYWRQRALPFLSDERVQMYTLAEMVQSTTPPDAIILIPPDWTGFQYASRRAQWVSFKAFPFEEAGVRRWKERLELVGIPAGDMAGLEWRRALAASYRNRTTEAWRSVLVRVDATHALLPDGRAPAPHVFCEHGWCLVELSRILPP